MSNCEFPWDEIADEHAKEFIMPWFKQCMDDFLINGDGFEKYVWFLQWFNQFMGDS